MTRAAVLLLAGAVGGVAAGALPVAAPPAARAVTVGQLLGSYTVQFGGDGWIGRAPQGGGPGNGQGNGPKPSYRYERVKGRGVLEIEARDETVNDGMVRVRVHLDDATRAGTLGLASAGTPAFEGTAAVIGDSLSVIGVGQPQYVSVMTLRFTRNARNVTGSWTAVFPALEADLETQRFATGVTVTVTGRRSVARSVEADGPRR